MITRVTVPQLDANTIDVTVTAWHKTPGDSVQTGEIIAELTTDKASFELESNGSGVLLAILASVKSVVPSGYILALLGEPGETDADAVIFNRAVLEKYRAEVGQPGSRTVGQSDSQAARPPDRPTAQPPNRLRATPRARRLAQERGLDLARIQSETGAAIIDEAVLKPYLEKL